MPYYDFVREQTKDKELLDMKEELQSGKASQAINSKYILLDNVLYYLSKADSDTVIFCFIPESLRKEVNEQYHNNNGHMGIDRTCEAMKTKYYWPNMYKSLYQYITSV